MSVSSIDESLLMGRTISQPETPEVKNSAFEDNSEYETDYKSEDNIEEDVSQADARALEDASSDNEEIESREIDDYGNETPIENKENPKSFREKMAEQTRKHRAEIEELRAQLREQNASPELQKAASDFEYNPSEEGDWQAQLASFVKQTVNNMGRDEARKREEAQEREVQAQFEAKFQDGMSKFNDFRDVMMGLNFEITNPMTLATRAMNNPAAFLYAAAKRHPQELERISKLRDPYAQMTEIGKLEERMRRNKSSTTAPKPLGRTIDDGNVPERKKSKEPSIEDLIAQSEARKMQKLKSNPGRRR